MRLRDYIIDIVTLDTNINEADGAAIINIQVESVGISGDAQGRLIFPPIELNVNGYQVNWGEVSFPVSVHSQNVVAGSCEFNLNVNGSGGPLISGIAPFPLPQIYGIAFSGNHGSCYFRFSINGAGNANREYELCLNPNS